MKSGHALACALAATTVAHGQPSPPPPTFRAYQAQMAAAEKSLRLDEARELHRWLDTAEPRHRGWEWAHLGRMADSTLRRVGTPDRPIRVAIAPAGDRVATVEGRRVRLWSWPDLEPITTIDGHGDAVYRAEFDPAGRRIITVARDVTSRVWDVESGRELARVDLVNPAFAAATFGPDGTTAATCAWERDENGDVHGLVWLWDPATGDVRERRRVGVKPLSSIRFTPDGATIVVGSWDGIVHVLDASDLRERTRLVMPDDGAYTAVNDVAVHPAGDLVAAGAKDRTIRVFSLASGALVATLRGHQGWVEGLAFSRDGRWLASASGDTTVRRWRTEGWSLAAVLRGPVETVRGVVWAADGETLIACSLDGALNTWSARTATPGVLDIAVGLNGTYSAAQTPVGRRVAVACFDGTLRIFDTRTGELVRSWTAHPGSTCHAAAYSADGSRLVTCSWDGTARVWPGDATEPIVLDAEKGVYTAAISPDGTRVALSSDGVQIWDVDGRIRRHDLTAGEASPRRVAFSPDGLRVVSGWDDGAARIHEVTTGALVAFLRGGDAAVEAVTYAPDGRSVVTGDAAGVVRRYAPNGGEAAFACDTGGRGINEVAVWGDRIAVASDRLWLIDLEHGAIVLGLAPHADTIYDLTWSADGRRLATVSSNGTVAVLEGGAPASGSGGAAP